jgi:hypothetical protein
MLTLYSIPRYICEPFNDRYAIRDETNVVYAVYAASFPSGRVSLNQEKKSSVTTIYEDADTL